MWFMWFVLGANAQTPLIYKYNSNQNYTSGNTLIETGGILISPQTENQPVNVSGNANVEYKAGREIHIKPGFEAHSANGAYFRAHIDRFQKMDAQLLEPTGVAMGSVFDVGWFEKMEVGVKMPQEVEDKINLFFEDERNGGTYNIAPLNPLRPDANNNGIPDYNPDGINSYNPDEIDVWAEIQIPPSQNKENPTLAGYAAYGAQTIRWNLFFFREYDEDLANNKWIEKPTEYQWRLRYAPPFMPLDPNQSYVVTIKCKTNKNGVITEYETDNTFSFKVVPSNNPGYLEIGLHKNFRFSRNNQSFFGIGHNAVPEIDNVNLNSPFYNPSSYWTMELNEAKSWENNIAKALAYNANYFRSFMSSTNYSLAFDNYPNTDYNNYDKKMPELSHLDKIVELCKNNNAYLQPVLYEQSHLQPSGYADYGQPDYNDLPFYNSSFNVGTGYQYALKPLDFITKPIAIQSTKDQYRYYVARWGYSTNIAAWDLFNEVDRTELYVLNEDNGKNMMGQWLETLRAYLKNIDPNHLSTFGYAGIRFDDKGTETESDDFDPRPLLYGAFWQNPGISTVSVDFTSLHNYSIAKNNNRNRIKELILDNTSGIITYQKPYQIGEIGNLDYFPLTDLDFHNSLWASSMMGGITTGLSWGTNTALNGFQQNYVGLKNFFSDIDFEQDYYKVNVSNYDFLSREAGLGNNDNKFEYFAMTNFDETKAFGWVHNRSNYISAAHHGESYTDANGNIHTVVCPDDDDGSATVSDNPDDDPTLFCVDGVQSRDADDQKIKLSGFNQGRYRIEWYNTTTGNYILSQHENALFDGALWGLEIKIPFAIGPNLINDFAFKAYYDPQFGERLSSESTTHINKINLELDKVDPNLSSNLIVYPNPSSDIINVSYKNHTQISKIELYNSITQKVIEETNYENNEHIAFSIENLTNGIYILKVYSNSTEVKIFKITKQ
jgi:hypothetical protein